MTNDERIVAIEDKLVLGDTYPGDVEFLLSQISLWRSCAENELRLKEELEKENAELTKSWNQQFKLRVSAQSTQAILESKLKIAEMGFQGIKCEVGTSTTAWHIADKALASLGVTPGPEGNHIWVTPDFHSVSEKYPNVPEPEFIQHHTRLTSEYQKPGYVEFVEVKRK